MLKISERNGTCGSREQINKVVIMRRMKGECLIRISLEGLGSGPHLYLTLKNLRQENCYNFEASLIHAATTRPVRAI